MLKLKVVDLFSGCGGFSFGFQQAGFEIVLGIDNDELALKTFKLNHANSEVMNIDLSVKNNIKKIVNSLGKQNKIDVLIAGPPCQGFSLTGPRNEHDERNRLFYSVFELAQSLEPKPLCIIIENVPGLAKLYGGKAKKEVVENFFKNGYTVNFKEIFAPDYGVPQIRKRLFFVGLLNKYGQYEFPQPVLEQNEYITTEQAIGDLPSLQYEFGEEVSQYIMDPKSEFQKKMRNGAKQLFNHVGTRHTEYVKSVISQVPEGGNYINLPPGVGESRKFNEAWTRYHSQKPSKTIDTGHRNHFHYRWNRVPTVRENARLQTFPDKFRFLGSKTQQYRQVGNAVPPLLGYHIANKLINLLRK